MTHKTRSLLAVAAVAWLLAMPVLLGWPPVRAESITRMAQQEATSETGGADIFPAADRIIVEKDGTLRAWVGMDTPGVFSLVIMTKLGAVLDIVEFDKGALLDADAGRVFDWASRVDRSYNYRTSVTGAVTIYVDQVEVE